ncbi:hypothetical protein CASFOL_023337 [Castilleja foliolosa]|uniref:non-specific serine/threonine protein kinase n=1 Tax=Castilleja foliolosa TaxID=1961234 RepID=A0ABD3CKA1_9LAMI
MPPFVHSLLAALLLREAANSTCNHTFSCGGDIINVTYPFTGDDRHPNCGPPGLALTCRGNTTELTQNSVAYNVLQLDQNRKTLTLSRPDLYTNNMCPTQFHNTSLNPEQFSYGSPLNDVVTLFYGCNLSAVMPYNIFSCKSRGSNYSDAYSLIGVGAEDQVYRGLSASCNVSISVPVLSTAGAGLRAAVLSLEEALMQGFRVSYNVPHERLCADCSRLGGQCGFDLVLGQRSCVCGHGPCPSSLTPPPESSPNATRPFEGNNSSNLGMNIAAKKTSSPEPCLSSCKRADYNSD